MSGGMPRRRQTPREDILRWESLTPKEPKRGDRIYHVETRRFLRRSELRGEVLELFARNAKPGDMIELTGGDRYIVVVTDGRMMHFCSTDEAAS